MDPSLPPPLVYRVLKRTVQRVPPSVQSLNSHAAYLLVREHNRQLLLWIGVFCEEDDEKYALTIINKVHEHDFHGAVDIKIVTVIENEEPSHILDFICDLLWTDRQHYYDRIRTTIRKTHAENSSMSVGYIEKILLNNGKEIYDFQETCFTHPDDKGIVPKIFFVPTEFDTIAYVNTGDVWELWFGQNITKDEQKQIKKFVEDAIIIELNLQKNDFREEILAQLVHIIEQYHESILFSYAFNFHDDSLTLSRPPEYIPSEQEWLRHKKKLAERQEALLKKKREERMKLENEEVTVISEGRESFSSSKGTKEKTSKAYNVLSESAAKELDNKLRRLTEAPSLQQEEKQYEDDYKNDDDMSYVTDGPTETMDHSCRCCCIS